MHPADRDDPGYNPVECKKETELKKLIDITENMRKELLPFVNSPCGEFTLGGVCDYHYCKLCYDEGCVIVSLFEEIDRVNKILLRISQEKSLSHLSKMEVSKKKS